jgi:succinylarginine dihydrolase
VHITPANLVSKFHRSIEPVITANYLKQIFYGSHFIHHNPLPANALFADEGAANYMRLSQTIESQGTEIFVYGGASSKYPARQSLRAFESIARLHHLRPENTIFLKQNPLAIDEGVFHNDVIAMSNGNVFIYHEHAYEAFDEGAFKGFRLVKIKETELSLNEAVTTYFFNSQLITLPSDEMVVIAPEEAQQNKNAKACFDRLISEGFISNVFYLDLHESMKNGGGPACLRLRVQLNESERQSVHPNIWLNDVLYNSLCQWIEKHYRDKLTPDDLRDPQLVIESQESLSELLNILSLRAEIA